MTMICGYPATRRIWLRAGSRFRWTVANVAPAPLCSQDRSMTPVVAAAFDRLGR
jgi:hypothetical protein